jgi:quinol monooxygenase YgiN
MNKSASLVLLKAKPGQRDEVRRLWEKYARDYVSGSAFNFYYCYDDADPDRIIVFGLGDQASIREFAQQPWFADYQRDTQALLAEPGEIRSTTPQYVKDNAR